MFIFQRPYEGVYRQHGVGSIGCIAMHDIACTWELSNTCPFIEDWSSCQLIDEWLHLNTIVAETWLAVHHLHDHFFFIIICREYVIEFCREQALAIRYMHIIHIYIELNNWSVWSKCKWEIIFEVMCNDHR